MRTDRLQKLLTHLGTAPTSDCSEESRAKLQAFAENPHGTTAQFGALASEINAAPGSSETMTVILDSAYVVMHAYDLLEKAHVYNAMAKNSVTDK